MKNQANPNLNVILILSGIVLVLMLGVTAWAWDQIPAEARLPVHWGVDGQPDRLGSKAEALLVTPGIGVLVVLLLYFIPRFDPRRENLAQSMKAYKAVWGVLLVILAGIHTAVILAGLGYPVDMGGLIFGLVGIMFVVIGNFMGKIRSNFFFGIRTPWTLSSELSWNKTHRLGGRLFIATGLLMVLSAFITPIGFWVYFLIGSLLLLILILVVYSYQVWRQDPAVQGK